MVELARAPRYTSHMPNLAPLSPHFSHVEAFNGEAATVEQIANARQLARQAEFLRMILGNRKIEVMSWCAGGAVHPDGEGHLDARAMDIRAPSGSTVDAVATTAFNLGFYRVTKLEKELVHIEIPPSIADADLSYVQQPLTRVARQARDPRVDRVADARPVSAFTPEITAIRTRPAEALPLVFTLAGFDDLLATRLCKLLPAVRQAAVMHDVPTDLFLAITIQEGAGRPDAYRSEGPHWHARNIASGKAVSLAVLQCAYGAQDPDQWGSAGAWQMLRSTAINLGFSPTTPWATQLRLRSISGEIDQPTGLPRGAKTGTFSGAFADPGVAAEYTALYLHRLLDIFHGDVACAVAAYNAGADAVRAARREAGEAWFSVLARIAQNDAAKSYMPSVLALRVKVQPAFSALLRAEHEE